MKDRNIFNLVNTIGNIFTCGCATRENITDGVYSIFHQKKISFTYLVYLARYHVAQNCIQPKDYNLNIHHKLQHISKIYQYDWLGDQTTLLAELRWCITVITGRSVARTLTGRIFLSYVGCWDIQTYREYLLERSSDLSNSGEFKSQTASEIVT